ncbi:MAG: hypothetical protein F4Y82_01910 [Cenarchaeum sp. SB0665_bin_23]|nr:hypothetical protein [Cenarchaeum sp. SB0665_bin_23]
MIVDIDDADHVARYCSPRKIKEDGTPAPGAFRLRDCDNCCLSVNWLECFRGQSIVDNILHVRSELCQHRELRKNGRLAVLNVGKIKRAIKITNKLDINVKRNPRNNHRSHACIGGYPTNNNEVAMTLSEMVGVDDMYNTTL